MGLLLKQVGCHRRFVRLCAEKQRTVGVDREMYSPEVILPYVGDELLEGGIISIVITHDAANLNHLTNLLFERQALERSIGPALLGTSCGADGLWLEGLCLS